VAVLICALAVAIPLDILTWLLRKKNCFLQLIAIILILFVLILDIYISLTNAALMGVDASNAWA
jgi:hypothetical protein